MHRTSVSDSVERPARTDHSTTDLARSLPLGDLLALGMQLRDDLTPEALLQEVSDAIHTVLGYPQVYVRLRNTDTDELEAMAFTALTDATIAWLRAKPAAPAFYQGLLQQRYRLGDSYLIPPEQDVEHGYQPFVRSVNGPGVLLVPLRGRGDRLIGIIYASPPANPQALAGSSIQLLEAIARQAALSLENARLAARTARLLAKEQLLAELGRDVSNTLDLDTILVRTTDRLQSAFQGGTIALLNEQDELEIAATVGQAGDLTRTVWLKRGEGICGWVALHGLPFLTNDTRVETRVLPANHGASGDHLTLSSIAVPLRSGGRIIGTLSVESHLPNAFTYEDVDLLEAVASQIGGPIASAQLYRQTESLADQVERRNEQLTVLNTIARAAVSTLDLERMLHTVTIQVQQGFGYDHVEVYTIDDELGEFVLGARAGPFVPNTAGNGQPLSLGLLGRAYAAGRTVRVDDVRLDADFYPFNSSETRSELCVPIVAGSRVLAILNLESRRVGAFTGEDVSVLETVADVLASAIENARLYQRAQEAAVLEERSRLARDLHDSISQQLFSMTLTAQAARAQIEKNPGRASEQLERLQETAAAALGEMRALIFQLRPPGLSEQGLVAALQQHAAGLSRREGLTVHMHVEGEERFARGAEQAIYRIAQEALNNVVRHAGTCEVQITMELQPDLLRLSVSDDGRGFDPANPGLVPGRHLGLISMRERATEIGGSLDVRSYPGRGTEIVLVVPREASDKVMGDG